MCSSQLDSSIEFELHTRQATESDEPFLRQMFHIVREHEFEAAGMTPEVLGAFLADQYRTMRAYYAQEFPDTVYTILEHGGAPIGYEAVNHTDVLHLIDIALLPEFRNRGIGSSRLRRLMRLAAEAGQAMILSVEVFNPAQRLYERLGFEVEQDAGIYRRMRWTPH